MESRSSRKRYVLLAALIGMATARFPAMAEAPAKTLEDELQRVHLSLSGEAFQAGGVTMADAALELRMRTAFPISFESVEYYRDKDRLTLGDVLESFRALKARSDLSPAEAARLRMYEEMAVHQSTATAIGVRKKTFTLLQDHITVRAFLDRITQLDSDYLWKNYGTDKALLIVIRPRTGSVLNWSVPRICGKPQQVSDKTLYGPGGKLTMLFGRHDITRAGEISDSPDSEASLPDTPLDTCRDDLTAFDVLNQAIKAAGPNFSWSVSGIRGLRFLSFQKQVMTDEPLTLSVQLRDVYDPQFEIRTMVRVGEPFHVAKMNGSVKNEISGILRAPENGQYRLAITILEWQSEASNSRASEDVNLVLNKPWSAGVIQSTLAVRTIVLNRPERRGGK